MKIIKKYCETRQKLLLVYKQELTNFWSQNSSTNFISAFAYGTLISNPEEVWNYLKINGIESRPLICGSMGLQPFWKRKYGNYCSLRYADQVHNNGIYLPINADMNEEDVIFVCNKFKEIAKPFFFL